MGTLPREIAPQIETVLRVWVAENMGESWHPMVAESPFSTTDAPRNRAEMRQNSPYFGERRISAD